MINNHLQCGYKRTKRVKEGIKTSTLSQISLLNYSKTLTATGNNTKLLFFTYYQRFITVEILQYWRPHLTACQFSYCNRHTTVHYCKKTFNYRIL